MIGQARAVTVTLVALPGLFFAHPNSVATLGLVGYVLLFVVTMTWVAEGAWHRPRRAVPAVLALVAPPLLWVAAQSIHRIAIVAQVHDNSPPDETKIRVLTEALLNNPRFGAPIWLTSAFVLIGFVVALRQVRTLWLPVLHVVTWLVFLGVAAYQTNFSQLVTGFWYNTSPRLAAITVIPGVLLATLGLMSVSRFIAYGVRRLAPHARGPQVSLAVSALLLVAYLPSTGWNNAAQHQGRLEPFYFPKNPAQTLLTLDGERALQRLARSIPAGPARRGQPLAWHALLYAFTGRPVLFPTPDGSSWLSPSPIRDAGGPRARPGGHADRTCARPYASSARRTSSPAARTSWSTGPGRRLPGHRPGARTARVRRGRDVRAVHAVADHRLRPADRHQDALHHPCATPEPGKPGGRGHAEGAAWPLSPGSWRILAGL